MVVVSDSGEKSDSSRNDKNTKGEFDMAMGHTSFQPLYSAPEPVALA